jgi:chromosome transmission fidelity protein 1
VVGLPFANLGSRELQERMRFVKEKAKPITQGVSQSGTKDAGVELYENMCMKVGSFLSRVSTEHSHLFSLVT